MCSDNACQPSPTVFFLAFHRQLKWISTFLNLPDFIPSNRMKTNSSECCFFFQIVRTIKVDYFFLLLLINSNN